MKTQNKSDIITGVSLLMLSAFFSISLILQPFDFGAMGPGKNNIFYFLGKMLYSVYGFSGILIPVFLAIAGLSCFSSKWTARKTMRLLTALVPFFTCVITENICRSILKYSGSSFSVIKLIVTLVTGAMLMTIEFLGIGILADKIQQKHFDSKKYLKIRQLKVGKKENDFVSEKISASQTDEIQSEQKKNDNPVFDEISENKNESATDKINESPLCEDEIEDLDIAEDENEGEENINNASMITQEEFAALILPDEDENKAESNENDANSDEVDELVWNLPPQPNELPPEYDADFDEDNSDLDFPPKDDEISDENQENDINSADYELNEDFDNNKSDAEIFEEENQNEPKESAFDSSDENSSSEKKNHNGIKTQNEYNYFNIKENSSQKKSLYNKNDPYAAANYMKNVVKKSQFPCSIVIHDDSEEKDQEECKNETEVPRSKFPTKIILEQTQNNDFSEKKDGFNDFAEDENPDFSDFDIEIPAISSREKIENSYNNKENFDKNRFLKNANQNFEYGINLTENDDFISDDFEELEEIQEENDDKNSENENLPTQKIGIVSQAAQQEFSQKRLLQNATGNSVLKSNINACNDVQTKNHQNDAENYASASDVFEEMEAEIRKDYLLKQKQANNNLDDENTKIDDVAQMSNNAENVSEEMQNKNYSDSNSARNLTADELTDFFNAQQEENTPKGIEIQANPVQIGNRAAKKGPYVIPSDLLIAYKDDEYWVIDDATKKASLTLKQTLAEFNIEANIIGIKKGPVVTMFEILPAPGVKLRKIVELQDNIALNLAAQSVRIVAPIPGKQAVGIEVPNRHRSVVGFREIIEMNLPEWKKMSVPVILGKDILGKAQLIDLVKTPHMLIAGATGSGKSVCVNSLILSILYKRSFRDVKLILVDPKVVELKLYNNIPHLLTPVITEPKKALQALKWALCEMERRYALLDQLGVRDVSTYNQRIKEQQICTEKLPYIVIIIDEFADLMATSGKELETVIARLTAMSRAVGIHLVLATQRPSVNVITGLIKANIPTRIAFMVASRTDSNIIIDTNGAEKLLGRGDMLYASAVDPAPIRIQGTFVTDQEVEDVVRTVKEYGEPDYIDEEVFFDDEDDDSPKDLFGDPMEDDDPLYDQALEIVVQAGKASASYIQRKLKIGYNRAARLVEEMEERGIVGPANGSKPREIIHIP